MTTTSPIVHPPLGVNAVPFEPSANASGSRLGPAPSARGGRARRGRGNGRPQDSTDHGHQNNLPQPGQGEYLATPRAPSVPAQRNNRRPPRAQGPGKPDEQRQLSRNPANDPPVAGDHQRGGVAGNADGAVGGIIHNGENGAAHASSSGQPPRDDRPPRNRNRNSRNKKPVITEGQPSGPPPADNTAPQGRPVKSNPRGQPRGQPKLPAATGRRAAFGGKLSSYAQTQGNHHDADAENQFEEAQDRAMMGYSSVDRRAVFGMTKEADDLASRLIRGLTTRPFLECPICFSDLLPAQAIWSCLPTYSTAEPMAADTTCCYTPFHLSCMQDWSSRSLKEAREKARDRPAGDQSPITWRCPGCQKHRETTVTNYQCFCGRIKHLKATAENRGTGSIAVPHSCGQSCSRKRNYCNHPCPLPCHPGPCPPCNVSLVIPCASHGHPLTVKCSTVHGANGQAPTCDELCNRVQDCGCAEHRCSEPCHEGPCQECTVKEDVFCFCGKEEKSVKCGWKRENEVECGVREGGEEKTWRARFGCGRECGRLYDCGEHECHEVCCVLSPMLSIVNICLRHVTLTPSIRYLVRDPLNSSHIVHAPRPRSPTSSPVPDKNAQIPSRLAASLVLVPDPDVNTPVAVRVTKVIVRPARPT